jgi:hypothetical protein
METPLSGDYAGSSLLVKCHVRIAPRAMRSAVMVM